MLIVGNARGELFVVKNGIARGPKGVEIPVPWSDEGIHYGSVVLKGSRVYKPGGELVAEYNLSLVPYGLYGDGYVMPRYGLFVRGESLYIMDLRNWAVVRRAKCLGKWDYMPVYPFADEKSLYCTDGYIAYVTPVEYGVIPAPCGVSYYVDVLNPGRGIVVDYEYTEEGLSVLAKVVSLRGEYIDTVEMEFRGARAVEVLSSNPFAVYVEDDSGTYILTRGSRISVEKPFFLTRAGVVVADVLNGVEKLKCVPAHVHGNYYVCGEEVLEIGERG
ncbi:hypothetical protein [Pyrobaculum aerophilum]|uniref:Uncharacterized protein n=2 Tax=Pyrobaculum aerophilum TaxID=13773 RepID=Q8ZSR7_PYRAE|nr:MULTISPECIES: hypothetical protein [Pyrobaculum]AAL65046.1 hypothetical protein PAE3615 [Pyrobaculum aerophilum str. IM2]MCX8137642.1 hypothetical protein [Pyrobaculum aerophilum]HII47824.1 hypothetical protein [Pyrobaculum aerophilum]